MSLVPAPTSWNPLPLQDRVVLITGGAQGVGRGIAQAVLGAGGRVVIGDLDTDAGKACMREWALPDRTLFVRVDVAKEASVVRFVERARDRFGHLDGLVNNAGIADPHTGPLAELDWQAWQHRLSSLHGAFLCSKHALPSLQERAGAIVNIASTRAAQSEPHSEAYAAAKGGLVAFTHALSVSAGPQVRVNCISPGWIATQAWQAPARRRQPKLSRRDHAQHPAGRVGMPDDIGGLAVYLLSNDLSGFITGQNVTVDGGMTKKMQYA